MSIFSGSEIISEIRAALAKTNRDIEACRDHLMHVHNLQHSLIQEVVNLTLFRRYDELGKDKTFDFEYDNIPVKMFLPTGPDDLIQRDIIWKRSFFHAESLEMIRELMPMRGERILDIGAYIGNHTVYFSKICGAAEVESFEPIRASFRALSRNVELNQVNAKLHNVGLGALEKNARATVNSANAGGSSLTPAVDGGIKVVPLDSLPIEPFRCMKIDVEGMALEVLQGARESIQNNRPSIVVEAFPHEYGPIHGYLESLHYRKIGQTSDDYVYVPE